MVLFESEATRVIGKFNRGKFKIEMLLASVDLWNIVDKYEEIPYSNVDPRVKKEY